MKNDHKEREFKRLIIGGILGLLLKSSKTREASYKSREVSYKWSAILSVLDLLKIFSELIVASKRGRLATIEKQAVIKTGPIENFL